MAGADDTDLVKRAKALAIPRKLSSNNQVSIVTPAKGGGVA